MFINPSDQRFYSRTNFAVKNFILEKKLQNSFLIEPFDAESTQGYVGVLSLRKNSHLKLVYKISREEDNLILHEYEILRQLDRAARKCPHFVKVYGLSTYFSPVRLKPLSLLVNNEEPQVERNILLLEYIHNCGSFLDFLQRADAKKDYEAVVSLISQVLISLKIAHSLGITHNDIHCDNILVKKCNPDITLKYIFQNKEIFVPTRGLFAVIIDFGLGRSSPEPKGSPLFGSFCFTHLGYSTDEFCPNTDYIRFLCNVRVMTKKKFPQIHKWCSKLLLGIRGVDQNIGWDKIKADSTIEEFSRKIISVFPEIALIEETLWAENLQVLVSRPVQNMDSDIHVFDLFFKNWKKFEERISSSSELNYLFKSFVFAVKLWKDNYLQRDPAAVELIKKSFLEKYEMTIKFHCPQVNYDDMIGSIILGASYLEGFFFRHLQSLKEKIPKRSGILSRKNCGEEVWKSFQRSFEDFFSKRQEREKIKTCYLINL